MLGPIKRIAIRALESHPIGYAIGAQLVNRLDFLLPHEEDYWGFRRLTSGRSKGLFLDLGANLGHSARGFRKVVPGWQIFSIEANPAHRSRLEKLKKQTRDFDFRIAAVDSESGRSITFFVPYYRGVLSLHSAAAMTLAEAKKGIALSFPRQEKHVRYAKTEIETITIDDLGLAPDIIKMDIQGKEFNALQGARKVIEQCSPDLLVEVCFESTDVMDYLRALGYTPYAYEKSTDNFVRFEGIRLNAGARNLFFSRRTLEDKTKTGH